MSGRSSRALRRIAPMVEAVRHDEGINRLRLAGLEDKIKALEARVEELEIQFSPDPAE